MNSLENVFGIDLVELCGPLCTVLTCGAVFCVTSSVAIAVGVGRGVGLTMHQYNTSRFQMQRTQLIRLKILFCEINSSFRQNKQLRFID